MSKKNEILYNKFGRGAVKQLALENFEELHSPFYKYVAIKDLFP